MNLVLALRDKYERGLTLTEVLLVLALGSLVAYMTLPVSLARVHRYEYQVVEHSLLTILRSAQEQALHETLPHGVKVFGDTAVLFEGENFSSRAIDRDTTYSLATPITVLGADEFVFSSGYLPATPATLEVQVRDRLLVIAISGTGLITLQ